MVCVYCPFFRLQNVVCFVILTYLVRVVFTIYIQSVLKFKKNISGAKMLCVYSRFFSLQNVDGFIILTCLVPVVFTMYIQSVLKFKKNNSGAKSSFWNVTVGGLAAALPVDYSHPPTVEPADSSCRTREPSG